MFDDYATIIQQEYPDIIIQGNNYDPPGMNMFLARLIVSIPSVVDYLLRVIYAQY